MNLQISPSLLMCILTTSAYQNMPSEKLHIPTSRYQVPAQVQILQQRAHIEIHKSQNKKQPDNLLFQPRSWNKLLEVEYQVSREYIPIQIIHCDLDHTFPLRSYIFSLPTRHSFVLCYSTQIIHYDLDYTLQLRSYIPTQIIQYLLFISNQTFFHTLLLTQIT